MHFETDRLIVRDLDESDLASVHAWRSDPEVAQFMDFVPANHNESKAFLLSCVTWNREDPRHAYNCAIVRKTNDDAIGWIGWGPPSETKVAAGDIDFGYALRRDCWDQGYGSEALRGTIGFVLEELEFQSFFGETDVQNTRSAHVMEKAGMTAMGGAPWDATSLWFRVRQL